MTSDKRAPLSGDQLLSLGEQIDAGNLPGAAAVLSQAQGLLLPEVAGADDLVLLDLDGKPLQDEPGKKRKRRKKPPLLDASGYPTIQSLSVRAVRALVHACWARCHGKAMRGTGLLAALRELERRQLVETAPASVSGDSQKWYAATALGALVVLKGLLRGSSAVVRAAGELR